MSKYDSEEGLKMKIDIKTINNSKTIKFSGDEEWLNSFYKAFPNKNKELLAGQITLKPDEYEHCELSGEVNYPVILECTRCTAPVKHVVSNKLNMLFRPSKYDLNANEVELSSGELDANYMSENDEIDVCQVLIDFVNDQLPDFTHCPKCAKTSDKEIVYRSENDEKLNPFAKLKDLKFPN